MHQIQRRSHLLVSRSLLRQLTLVGSLACVLAACAEEAPPPPFGSNSPNASVTPTPVTPTASPTIATSPPGSVPSPDPSQAPQPTAPQPTAPDPAGTPTMPQGPAAMPPMPGTPTTPTTPTTPAPQQPEQPAAVPTTPEPAPAPAAGVTCDAAWSVGSNGYVRAPGAGDSCWGGYAYAFAENGATISPEDFETCGAGCTLCVAGTVAATASYNSVAAVGFNLNQGASGGAEGNVTPSGSIGVNITNRGGSPLRVQINGASEWCTDISAQTGAITLQQSSFNTACWDNSGTAYAGQPIKALMLLIPGGGPDDDEVTFDVCLNGVTPP